jgi:hypothetical protein
MEKGELYLARQLNPDLADSPFITDARFSGFRAGPELLLNMIITFLTVRQEFALIGIYHYSVSEEINYCVS